jgi:hypothetical protein
MSTPVEVEVWRPIPLAPGYEASDLGRIRSVDRVVMRGNGVPQRVRARVLRPVVSQDGRHWVHIGGRHRRIPNLVLEAFVGLPQRGLECCHRDDDPSNNRLSNLRWGTRSDNTYDRVRNGRHHLAKRHSCLYEHLLVAPNLDSETNRRRCLACRRARHRARRLSSIGVEVDVRELADSYYRQIMSDTEEAS